jgi:hypothetical protein
VATLYVPTALSQDRNDPDGMYVLQLAPDDNSQTGMYQFFPIQRNDDELFMAEAMVKTSGAGNDPVAIIEIDWLAFNLEAGAGDYVTFGVDAPGGMFRSASPKTTPNRYLSFWYGNSAAICPTPNTGAWATCSRPSTWAISRTSAPATTASRSPRSRFIGSMGWIGTAIKSRRGFSSRAVAGRRKRRVP